MQKFRLLLVTLSHFCVDSYATLLTPLLPLLRANLGLSLAQTGFLGTIVSICNISQPLMGLWADRMARRCYRALNLSGFARLDLRLSAEGNVFLIDANPNPDLSDGEDFSASAKKSGIAYPQLVQKVLNLGLGYVPAWKGA